MHLSGSTHDTPKRYLAKVNTMSGLGRATGDVAFRCSPSLYRVFFIGIRGVEGASLFGVSRRFTRVFEPSAANRIPLFVGEGVGDTILDPNMGRKWGLT